MNYYALLKRMQENAENKKEKEQQEKEK